jgi:cephalosporin hydroxylase
MKTLKSVNRSLGLSQDNIFRKLRRIINYGLELLLVRLYNKSSSGSKDTVDQFHSLYYCSPERTWNNTRWMGRRTMRCPLDLWVYQEIIYKIQPDIVIETGTNEGGGAHYLASIMDVIGKGRVVGVDIEELDNRADHERITYIKGSSVDSDIIKKVSKMIEPDHIVLVILDSDHNMSHVLKEMNIYSDFVTKGSYMIIEDSNINGNPVMPNWGAGPFEAIQKFLSENDSFEVDKGCEKFYMSFNPSGYLKKIKKSTYAI